MPEEKKSEKKPASRMNLVLFLILLAGNVVLGGLFYNTNRELTALKEDPDALARREVQVVVDQVSKLINLPSDLTPILATVNNAEELKAEQKFFAEAENGDKVLLYSQAEDLSQRKAYLYRPSAQKLLNVAPINIGGANQVQVQDDEFSIELRNGTVIAGLTNDMETLLKQIYPNATVADKVNASRDSYDKSVLVKVNASDELADKVAKFFSLEIVELPEGEADPGSVDLLLILGSTRQEE